MKLSRLSWALGPILAGCAGTSPNLSTPQMQTPQLGNNFGNRSPANAPGAAAEASLPALEQVKTPDSTFLAAPYLQLGNHPGLGKTDSLALLWHASPDDKAVWIVEARPATGGVWKPAEKPTRKTVAVKDIPPFEILSANLSGLKPGALFDYRVSKSGTPVFAARARARRGSKEAQRVVIVGDHASGAPESRKIAFQIGQAKPDLIVDTGDMVYDRGRITEYRERFFPVYNAEAPDAEKGASLTRATVWAGVAGNHDIANADLDKYPDGKAYFYLWNQPLNGPSGLGKSISPIAGADANQKAFLSAAGSAYPKAATYSFDAGNAHWTALDSNSYTNWTDPTLVKWLENDLKSSKATWKFVTFHHPPFHSSTEHENDQWMRVLCPIFEKYKVAIVWNGHVHNYQRTFPLKFAPTKPRDAKGLVEGTFAFDKEYDGQTKTKPTAPIYVVTGGGGAKLYSVDLDDKPEKWKPFTKKYVGSANSFTVMDIDGKKLTIQQISLDGKELDRFTVTQ